MTFKPCLLLFLLIASFCHGQGPRFNHLMTENGLSQNSVFAITQDSQGFMWFGTGFGLNRYDGNQFRSYKSSTADSTTLSNSYITSLYNDTKGSLWIGTTDGLNKFNPHHNTFQRFPLRSGPNKTAVYIRVINEDKKGNLWVGTNSGLYLRNSSAPGQFLHASQLKLPKTIADSEILSIYEDLEGYLWIGTIQGLVQSRFDKHFNVLNVFKKSDQPASISDNAVTAITEDLQKNLWIGTENGGINLFNRATGTFTRFLPQHNGIVHHAVRKMMRSRTGELWIGTLEGLSILNPLTRKFSTYQHHKSNVKSLNHNSIYSLYEDLNGSVWIGTYYGGVNVAYAAPTNFKFWQYEEDLPSLNHNVVSSIIEDKDRMWIGTEGGGLNYYIPERQGFGAYTFAANDPSSLGSPLVKIIYKDKSDQIWVGTHGGGLNLLDRQTGKFKRFFINKEDPRASRSEIVALLEDDQGKFWVGSQAGLSIFNKTGPTLQPIAIPEKLKVFVGKNIRFLHQDARKDIWIGTSNGIYLYSGAKNMLQLLASPKGKSGPNAGVNFANCLNEDSRGNIWIGLNYGGLAKYDVRQQHFTRIYTTKDGLSNDNVLGILEDSRNKLWVSTSNGLAKFDPDKHSFQTYTTSDGISADAFNYNSFFKNKDGVMFFGGYNGLTYFYPDEIQKNNFRAPIAFTGLLLFNKAISLNAPNELLKEDIGYTKKITFKYDQNIFSIQFALLSYIKSDKNRYAYKLEGINNQWIETSIPAASYTNLPSGSYKLLVKGANNDGVWSKPTSISIEIRPPFWKTWWAFCMYAIITAVILFFITRFFYLRELLIKDEELHQSKLNFFTNVSHEIRTHLTLIMAPVEKLLDGNQHNSAMNRHLTNVKNNTNRLMKLTSELMDFRKAETNNLKLHVAAHDLVTFIQEIGRSFEELSEKKKIHFSIIHDPAPIMVYFDPEQLEKVFFNLISNAFKFTPINGSISVEIKKLGDHIVVTVEDTGRGIAAEYLGRLFTNFFQVDDHSIQNTGYGIGLALSKHIVALHQGKISVSSRPAEGKQAGHTRFEVILKSGTKHFINTSFLKPPASISPKAATTSPQEMQDIEIPGMEVENPAKKHTVLIIEDHAELRQLIKESLIKQYRVLVAKNGLEGWENAIAEIPDLIISDVMMPGIDGFTLCNQLKSDERTSHIPVVLLTAKSSETDQISGLSGGADLYLTKPFSSKILQLHVRNLLSGREAMRQKFSKTFLLEPGQVVIESMEEQFLSRLIDIIERHMEDEQLGVELLAEEIGMSQSVLYKKLKALTNMSVNDFSKSIRLKRAAQLLAQKKYTVYEIGYMVGFSDRKYFSREFKKQFGKTPTEYISTATP